MTSHAEYVAAAVAAGSSLDAAFAGLAAYDEGVDYADCPFADDAEAAFAAVWRRYWLIRRNRALEAAPADLFELTAEG